MCMSFRQVISLQPNIVLYEYTRQRKIFAAQYNFPKRLTGTASWLASCAPDSGQKLVELLKT